MTSKTQYQYAPIEPRTISVGQLGLDLCGTLRRAHLEGTPLIVTTRREPTHVVIPLTLTDLLPAWANVTTHQLQGEERC